MNAEVFVDTNVLLYTIDEDPASRSDAPTVAGPFKARSQTRLTSSGVA